MGNLYKLAAIIVGAIVGFFGLLRTLGDAANGAMMLLDFGERVNITHGMLYDLCLSVGFVTFLYVLSELLYAAYRKWPKLRDKLNKTPDKTLGDAVRYIAYGSVQGDAVSDHQKEAWGWAALKKEIDKGRIVVFGTKENSPIQTRVRKAEIRGLKFKVNFQPSHSLHARERKFCGATMIDPESKEARIVNLAVRKRDIEKIFRPGRRRWW